MTVDENEVQLQLYARAPAPSRDYYGLTITQSKIILNIWNVSYGPHVYPKRHVSSLEEFPDQRYMQHDIQRTFGEYALQFARSFAAKERNFQNLPIKVFLKIVRYLATNDILHLSQTSKIFFDICNSEAVWKIIYKKRIKRRVMLSDVEKGAEIGWKEALKAKITSRLSLRNLLDKNEAKLNLNSPSNIISNKSSVPNISRVTNPNTSISNKSSTNLIKNLKDTPVENSGRYTRSEINLQKYPASGKIDCREYTKSCVRHQKDRELHPKITLPINKTKLLQSSITLTPSPLGKTLETDLGNLFGKGKTHLNNKKSIKNLRK